MEEPCYRWKSDHLNILKKKIVERETLIDSVSAQLKNAFLFEVFTAFCVFLVVGKDCHAVGRVVREVEMACNWFERIFFILSRDTKVVFSFKTLTRSLRT